MFIKEFGYLCKRGESLQVKLPRKNLQLDPRANFPNHYRFECYYHDDGITVTLTRVDVHFPKYAGIIEYMPGFRQTFSMRVYDQAVEVVPDFDSKTYLYLGVDGERAPVNTIIAIIDPSVKAIKRCAFRYCMWMKRCIMHGEVASIGSNAFEECISLDALFLPCSLKKVDDRAFYCCPNIRILPLPLDINRREIGHGIIECSDSFFRVTQILFYKYDHSWGFTNTDNDIEVNQAIIDFHRNLSPLHRACLGIGVSTQSIHDCIRTHGMAAAYNTDYDGMTPMHLLAINPHATTGPILECFFANMGAIFVRYSEGYDEHSTVGGKTPLECLLEYDLESHNSVVTALCIHRNTMIE